MTPPELSSKTLIVITGPTASGKTDLAIRLAKEAHTGIISADSRQIYAGIPIGTAAPDAHQLAAVPHHLVGILPLEWSYSADSFDRDVNTILPQLWAHSDIAIMCGGSMMYIDAFINGMDELPAISPQTRAHVASIAASQGPEAILALLRIVDPVYYDRVDRANLKRVIHAIEVSYQAGVPYSSLLTGKRRSHPFRIIKVAPQWPRHLLFERINLRTHLMVQQGLEQEARAVSHLRHLNSLNTVGYKEMFSYIDGHITLDEAIAKIARNTRVYAKKQLTWLKKDPTVHYIPHTALPHITLADVM
ncbi:MAG: tRNA (adenosine(37)-N6)-dimethylallyltransferase MiaA [Muribaculaceae bacterium]|nr:tRNA (adenosine(37)-N6)-dimethylallyltransferase MiaA [Muribaculaceae bacterium]